MDQARKGEKVVLFMDAAHFIFATFLGYIWCRTRYFLKSHTGRKRYNVLGALNAVSKKVSIYTIDTTLDALSVCVFLKQVFLLFSSFFLYQFVTICKCAFYFSDYLILGVA